MQSFPGVVGYAGECPICELGYYCQEENAGGDRDSGEGPVEVVGLPGDEGDEDEEEEGDEEDGGDFEVFMEVGDDGGCWER